MMKGFLVNKLYMVHHTYITVCPKEPEISSTAAVTEDLCVKCSVCFSGMISDHWKICFGLSPKVL